MLVRNITIHRTTPIERASKSGCAARIVIRRGPSAPTRGPRGVNQPSAGDLRLAAKRGDRTALSLALDQMPRRNSPRTGRSIFARCRIRWRASSTAGDQAGRPHRLQKGWKLPKPRLTKPARRSASRRRPPAAADRSGLEQPSLFEL